VDNIKMDLREIGWGGMDWIDLAQDRDQWRALVSTVMNLRVLQNVRKFLSSCTTGGFSRRAQLHEVMYVLHSNLSVFIRRDFVGLKYDTRITKPNSGATG
jgi:hypothetical protein